MSRKLMQLFLIFVLVLSATDSFNNLPDLFSFGNVSSQTFSIKSKVVNDDDCDQQLKLFSDALDIREEWALRLLDSWGKVQSGYFAGNVYNLGHFDECINYRFNIQPDNEVIQGRYCLVGFRAIPNTTRTEDNKPDGIDWREIGDFVRNQNLLLINGFCLPATCSPQKVVQFVNIFLNRADLYATMARCRPTEPIELETIDIVAILIFSIFGVLLIACTAYDVIIRHLQLEPNKLFLSFSVITNGEKLFDLSENTSTNSINCLLGLRAISVFWIMFGHRFTTQRGFPLTDENSVEQHLYHLYSVILSSYNIAVDTFFLMGALLITMTTLKDFDKRELNVPRMILHRYLRYTPVLAALILYIVSLLKFSARGIHTPDVIVKQCEDYWWSALLHIQNYANPNEQCVGHAWYLSVDFQLFTVSPLLIYPAWKYGWKMLMICASLALMSSFYVLTISLTKGVHVDMKTMPEMIAFSSLIYNPTHARLGPWMVGIMLGYALHRSKDVTMTISKKLNTALWLASLSVLTLVVVLTQPLNEPSKSTPLIANAFYICFHRLAWAVSIAWIVFACQKLKTGGVIRWFLSHPYWKPVGRMSLSIYLVHVFYQITMMMNQTSAVSFEIWTMLHNYWGDIIATSVLGAILYLTFEVPFLLIESYIYSRFHDKKT